MDKLIPVEIEAATELYSVPIEQFTEFEPAYEMTGGIVPTGTKQINITSNGTTTEDVTNYADAEITVNVPVPPGYIIPTGTKQISITSNGTTTEDVTNYAAAEITVNVSGGVTPTGTKEIEVDSAGTITEDVTNYASVEVTVPSGSASTPTTSITANPSISVSSSGLITASASASQSVTPTVSEGWVSSGSAGTVLVSGSNTSQLSTQGATTITPTTSQQTAVASGKYTTGNVVVDPIPSQYIIPSGSQTITQNGTVDVTALAEVVVSVSGGGSSGLEYESGTFTLETDSARPTVSFSKTHTESPFLVVFADATGTYTSTTQTNFVWSFFDYYRAWGYGVPFSSSAWRYATASYNYRTTSDTITTNATMCTYSSDDTGSSGSAYSRYWVTASDFKPSSASSGRYWRAGRTYKWYAIWKPTT